MENDGNSAAFNSEGVFLGLGTCVAGGFTSKDLVAMDASLEEIRADRGIESQMLLGKARRLFLQGQINSAIETFGKACRFSPLLQLTDYTALFNMSNFKYTLAGKDLISIEDHQPLDVQNLRSSIHATTTLEAFSKAFKNKKQLKKAQAILASAKQQFDQDGWTLCAQDVVEIQDFLKVHEKALKLMKAI